VKADQRVLERRVVAFLACLRAVDFFTVDFFAGDLRAAEVRVVFFAVDLRVPAGLVDLRGLAARDVVFFAALFFAAALRAGDFLAGAFRALAPPADFFDAVLRAVDCLALDFFAADFLVAARRGCLALGPGFAPPSCLFTVAQARRSASSLDTPRSS
jgi:hypothetical protein